MTTVLKTTDLQVALLLDLAAFKHPREAIGDVAMKHGLTYDRARDLVADHGYPDPAAMRTAAAILNSKPPALSTVTAEPDAVEQLLRKAEKSTKQRTRKMAEKARILLAELNQAVTAEEREAKARKAAEEERAWLQAEVDKLEKQLAEKKAALRGKPTTTAPKPSTSDNQTIRAWAAAAGIDCPARGRIPANVREQYDAATTAGAA